MLVIGLTGGIACGKSTVVKQFRKLGAKIIDADKIAHKVIKQKSVIRKIVKYFGKEILLQNKINRKKLAKIIFSNRKKHHQLEKIMHPIIITKITKLLHSIATSHKEQLIVLDAPLLFEAKITYLVDKIVVVWVPQKIQIQRLMKRDNLTRKEALQRLKYQLPLSIKKARADFLVDASKPLNMVQQRVSSIFAKMKHEISLKRT